MKLILLIILVTLSTVLHSQSVTIIGKVISPSDTTALGFANVYLGNTIGTTCDTSGKFSLIFDKVTLKDTLKINFPGFRKLFILNLPMDSDTINLGEIPMFQGYQGVPMVDFFCRWVDLRCRRESKTYWKNVEKENSEYVKSINKEIEKFRFIWNDHLYIMKYNENYFNLTLTIDLHNPEI